MNGDMQQDYKIFLNKITELKDMAALQGGFVLYSQINEAFPDLSEEQMNFIKEYFANNHIGIDEAIDPSLYMDESEVNLLNMYLESLEEVVEVSDSVKRVLMMEAIAGNKESKDKLMEQYLRVVIDTARLYSGQGVDLMDLIGEGNVALAMAMDSLECMEAPEDVEPLIMQMIMKAMEECVGQEGSEDDSEKKALALVQMVLEAAREMNDTLLRKVTVEEVAKESGISKKKIREALMISESLYDYIEKDEG